MTLPKIITKTFQVLAMITAGLLFLLLLLYILLHVPTVQNIARRKVVLYLEGKFRTKVEIAKLSLDFPKRLVLKGVYIEDQKKDTLLYGGIIQVDIAILKLIRSQVEINYIGLKDINVKIHRTGQDTVFNYQYIIDAFATKDSAVVDTSGGMKISVVKINLESIRASFKDDVTAIDFYAKLGKFKTTFKKFNLDKMDFSLPDIILHNVAGHLYQNKPLMKPQPSTLVEVRNNEPFKLQLGLQNIDIKNIVFGYKNNLSILSGSLNLGELSGKVKSIDLSTLKVELGKVKLHNTTLAIILGKSDLTKTVKKEANKEVAAQANNPWKINIANVDFENNNLAFKDENKPSAEGMDLANLKVFNFRLHGSNFIITPSTYKGKISSAGFTEQSGFHLAQLKTDFIYSDRGLALNNFYLQTDKTIIRNHIKVSYPSLDAVSKDMRKLHVDINLATSKIAAKDILIFAPQLQNKLKGYQNTVVHLNARLKGYLNNIAIASVELSGIGNTALNMTGYIKGLPDGKKALYDFTITFFQTTKIDLNKFLPSGSIPPNIRIPETIKGKGSFKGSAENFATNLLLQTNKGNVTLAGILNTQNKAYDLKGRLDNVDVGYFIKQDTLLAKTTMSFTAKGSGFLPTTMNTNVNVKLKSAFIKGYTYQNLNVVASLNKGLANIDAGMEDRNIAFRMKGEALIGNKFITNIKLVLLLDSILLQPLGFAATHLKIHGNMIAKIPTADVNEPRGIIEITDLIVAHGSKRHQAKDTITIRASITDTGKIIKLNSEIATAILQGKFNLATLGKGVMQVINKYYNLGIKDTAIANDKWVLNAAVIPDSLLFTLVPAMQGSDTISIKADFDGITEKFNLLVYAPKIKLGEQVLESLTVTANNESDRLAFSAALNTAGSKNFRLRKTSVVGTVANNELYSTLTIKDIDGKNKYQLGVKVVPESNGNANIRLTDTLMLDYETWRVSHENNIRHNNGGFIIRDFTIRNSGQSLSINSKSEDAYAPIDVVLKNFHIKTITHIAEHKSMIINGLINGSATVKNLKSGPIFIADMRLDSLTYNTDTIGNIIVKIDNEAANAFHADVSITGNKNDVTLTGKYFTGDGKMDMKLAINHLNMASLKPFTFGTLTQADGNLQGNVAIKGTVDEPKMDGVLRFENANITPKASGEKLHLSNEVITVSSNDISFDNFNITDSKGSKVIINGKITTEDFKSYNYNVGLVADNFRVLTSPPRQSALYYGNLNMDADVKILGALTAPSINAALKINKSTDITFILPSNSPEIEDRNGVVLFGKMHSTNADSIFKSVIAPEAFLPEMPGIDFTGTLESDTAAKITLVIDERTGDALKIKGKAELTASIDKSGNISLNGNYDLQNGSYQLTLSLLKKQFIIQPGSVIKWTGDPTSADIDITAIYVANTQPVNLLQSELASLSAKDINKYKVKLPFNVLLKMKGKLLKPIITFDIKLPENQKSKWDDVETKLEQIRSDEAELNKQVFALMLLNRFVQENPMDNAADATSLASRAKSSVSKILAEQLNNLAGSLVKGVDLNFGLNTDDDYSSGKATSRTNLTVGVSKNLLNDRLRVSIGSDFETEGPANTNQQASNIAGDVAVDYLLSKDGRYTLRAYRRNEYEGVIEGQVVESGVSFIFSFDFNQLKEIINLKTEQQKLIQKAENERKDAKEKSDKSKKEQVEKRKTK